MIHGGEIAFGPGEEFRLIRRMLRRYGALADGVGDDAATVPVGPGETMVLSTDASVEGVHFRRGWFSPGELGYRAVMAAASDLAAMGARPVGMLVALTIPERWRAELDDIGDGIARAARATSLRILGGNTSDGADLSLTVTVVGAVRAGEILTRTAARAGDRVYVTGRLGAPGAALRSLIAGAEPAPVFRGRLAEPVARIAEARWLAGQGARAAIDISDGLLADAGHVAAASHVHLAIELERLPLVEGVRPADAARSGEEYELLVTSPIPLDQDAFAARFAIPLTEIATVQDGDPRVTILHGGRTVTLRDRGHDHFRRR